MKTTLMTIFAIVVMIFVFGTNSTDAYSSEPKGCKKARTPSGQIITECWLVDNLREPDQAEQADNER